MIAGVFLRRALMAAGAAHKCQAQPELASPVSPRMVSTR
jgi:hypothetical protein